MSAQRHCHGVRARVHVYVSVRACVRVCWWHAARHVRVMQTCNRRTRCALSASGHMSESAEHEFKQHNSDHTLSSFLTARINFIKYWNIYSLDVMLSCISIGDVE